MFANEILVTCSLGASSLSLNLLETNQRGKQEDLQDLYCLRVEVNLLFRKSTNTSHTETREEILPCSHRAGTVLDSKLNLIIILELFLIILSV